MTKIIYKNMHVYVLHRSNELDHEHGRPAIFLKYKLKKSLVWCGTSKKDLITKEKPLVINLGKIKNYFYSSGIERVYTTDLKQKWVDYKTNTAYKLSNSEQQKLISKFVTFTLEKDPYLKIQELEQENKKLKNEIELLKQSNLKNRNRG